MMCQHSKVVYRIFFLKDGSWGKRLRTTACRAAC